MKKEKEKKSTKEKQDTRENKKSNKLLYMIPSILLTISAIFIIYTITLISGIETELRIIAIIALILINILLLVTFKKLYKKKKISSTLILIFCFLIGFCIQTFVGIFVYKTYASIDNMNKDKITYETVIITLKNSKMTSNNIKSGKIGIVKDESSIDGYLIGLDLIKSNNISEENITYYNDNSIMVAGLYDKEVDAIIISNNYPSMFRAIDKFKDIEDDTRVIANKEKTYTKKEIEKITGEKNKTPISNANSITEPFTMLIMGIDSTKENLSKNATGNGDALMVVTFNPKTLNATILSIPRDTYVPIACFANQKENKITHAAWNGESCMMKTIENFTGIPIDYYVKINFKGVVKLVDALGGIDVNVPIEFCEQNSDRKKDKNHQLCLKKGFQNINGEEALALARHRKTLLTGDIQRGENQQIVVQGILNKAKSIKSPTDALNILNAISNSMDTNFTTKQILSFYDIAKTILMTSSSENPFNIQQLQLAGSSQMIYDESMRLVLYNYIPNQDSIDLIVKAMKENLGINKINHTYKTLDFNIEETYTTNPIGKSGIGATRLYTLLPNFTNSSQGYAQSWLSSRGIKVSIVEKEVTQGKSGIVLEQSLPASKRVDLIGNSGITLTISKLKSTTPVAPPVTPSNPDNENNENNNENNNQNPGDNNDNNQNTEDNNNTNPDDNNENSTPES